MMIVIHWAQSVCLFLFSFVHGTRLVTATSQFTQHSALETREITHPHTIMGRLYKSCTESYIDKKCARSFKTELWSREDDRLLTTDY